MSTSRYAFQPIIDGKFYATSELYSQIYQAIDRGEVPATVKQLSSATRLDILAFECYGDASLWWIIAAASGIGWSMQLSPGAYVRVPTDLNVIYEIMRS